MLFDFQASIANDLIGTSHAMFHMPTGSGASTTLLHAIKALDCGNVTIISPQGFYGTWVSEMKEVGVKAATVTLLSPEWMRRNLDKVHGGQLLVVWDCDIPVLSQTQHAMQIVARKFDRIWIRPKVRPVPRISDHTYKIVGLDDSEFYRVIHSQVADDPET